MQQWFAFTIVFLCLINSNDALAQCTKDTDCKGDRVCENGVCKSPSGTKTSTKPPATAPLDSSSATLPTDPYLPKFEGQTEPDGQTEPSPAPTTQQQPTQTQPAPQQPAPGQPSQLHQQAPPPSAPSVYTGPPSSSATGSAEGSFSRDMGLQLGLGFGVSDCTDDWCDNLHPLVGLPLTGLLRFASFLGVGVHMAFLFYHPKDKDGADSVISWDLIVGPELTGMLPLDKLDQSLPNLDIWTSFMFGYNRSAVDVIVDRAEDFTYNSWIHSPVLGWGIGANYFFSKNVAAGLSFRLYKPWPKKGCAKSSAWDSKECYDYNSEDREGVGIYWWAGFSLYYHIPLGS